MSSYRAIDTVGSSEECHENKCYKKDMGLEVWSKYDHQFNLTMTSL